MKVLVDKKIKSDFLDLFDIAGSEFSDFIPYLDDQVGFSVRHSRKGRKEASLIRVTLVDNKRDGLYPVFVDATFGVMHAGGIKIRTGEETSAHDPIDINVTDDYVYDPEQNEIFKNDKAVTGLDVLTYAYNLHLKTTRPFLGFCLRIKLWFWRRFLRTVSKATVAVLTACLFVVSGTKYDYDPFFDQEKIVMSDQSGASYEGQNSPEKSEGQKLRIFEYQASRWSIIFYCSAVLFTYFTFSILNYKPRVLIDIIKNNYLVVLFAIVSLWMVDSFIPNLLKGLIRRLARYTLELGFKKITVK